MLAGTQSHGHARRAWGGELAGAQEEGEMCRCGGERQLEEVLNDNGVERVSKLS